MKCAKCGKPSDDLKQVLYIGSKGFRKYLLCPKCKAEIERMKK
jgi:DNA-directed RNA polymerase subunit RPC12/RpoP